MRARQTVPLQHPPRVRDHRGLAEDNDNALHHLQHPQGGGRAAGRPRVPDRVGGNGVHGAADEVHRQGVSRPRLEVVTLYAAKAKLHQAGAGLDLLKVVRVSKAQTKQRTCRESEGTLSESPQHQEKCNIPCIFNPSLTRLILLSFRELNEATTTIPEIQ